MTSPACGRLEEEEESRGRTMMMTLEAPGIVMIILVRLEEEEGSFVNCDMNNEVKYLQKLIKDI